MKKLAVVISTAALLASASTLWAASTIYGVSGLVEVPDDSITPTVAVTAHSITDIGDSDSNVFTFGGAVKLLDKLELSAVAIDIDAPGVDTEFAVNAKYRIVCETMASPSITVGVVDVFDSLDEINSEIDNPSVFISASKNLFPTQGMSILAIRPLRGTLGFGTGVYKGIFAALDWSFAPKTSAIVEYLSNGIEQDSTVNLALRFNPVQALSLQGGVHDLDEFYIGGTFTFAAF